MIINTTYCSVCGTTIQIDSTANALRPLCFACRNNEAIANSIGQSVFPGPVKDEPSETREILTERGKRYGKFSTHAEISQALLQVCQGMEGDIPTTWGEMKPHQREALTLIMHKIARILNGDPNYDDSWKDIAGYSQLVVDILNKDER